MIHLALLGLLTLTAVTMVPPRPSRPIIVTTSAARDPRVEMAPVSLSLKPLDAGEPHVDQASFLPGELVREPEEPALLGSLDEDADSGQSDAAGNSWEQVGLDLPANAVQAGSFAAWWIPKVERYGETVEPGQLPRVGQDYRIHVQIRIPADREVLRIDDLSGEIIGTDGYRQLIPGRAWVQDENGKLVPAVGGRRYVHATGGVVEIVFKVDAAGRAGVRDTIRIRSRILDEEQTLTLEFQPVESEPPGSS